MKSTYIIWSIVILFSTTIHSQWTNQNPVPEGNHLWSMFFIDDNTGWIVGSDGFIKKTTNAGLDWVQQNSGTTLTLKSVQFLNQNIGWLCGEEGLIIKTTDGGQSWFEQMSGTTELLTDLNFCDLNIGYVIGYNESILKTTDGGLNWVSQNSGSAFDLYSVDFVDENLGYAVGGKDSSNFLKTTNGGLSWTKKTLNLGALNTPILNCVEFVDANVGWIGSEGQFLNHSGSISKTTDGGESWFSTTVYNSISRTETILHPQEDNPIDNQRGIRSIYFKDSNNGFAVGGAQDGWWRSIFTTTDAGATWQNKYSYSEQTGLISVFVNINGKGLAAGYYGVMYMTEDNGSSWFQILSGTILPNGYTGDWITSVFMINDSVGWAGGYRKGIQIYPMILKTTNGGKTWKTNLEKNNNWYDYVTDIFFIDENVGWASITDIGLMKTTDGGADWLYIGYNPADEIFFVDQDIGWIASTSSFGIRKSTDGGVTWVQKYSAPSSSIYFSDLNNGWAVGLGGEILKSTDGGETWISKISGTASDLNSVHFYDNNIGMCVGNSGTVLLSTDGGENWISHTVGTTAVLNSVVLTNATTAWIAGSDGIILNTIDLGNNWISYSGVTGVNLISISFTSENTGWFGGWNGTILKYQNDVTPVELVSFIANVENNNVHLIWQTATELNNFGYEIERKVNDDEWNSIGFVEGNGNSSSPKSYSYIDNSPIVGNKINYRLKQVDTDGKYEYSNEVEVDIFPTKFELYQNYPNPFNPTTKIRYVIPAVGTQYTVSVQLKVYDILGNEVATIVNEKKEPGNYEVEFDPASSILNPASGIYFYRLTAGDPSTGSQNGQAGQSFVETKKMILMK